GGPGNFPPAGINQAPRLPAQGGPGNFPPAGFNQAPRLPAQGGPGNFPLGFNRIPPQAQQFPAPGQGQGNFYLLQPQVIPQVSTLSLQELISSVNGFFSPATSVYYEARETRGKGSYGEVFCAVPWTCNKLGICTRQSVTRCVKKVSVADKLQEDAVMKEVATLCNFSNHPSIVKFFEALKNPNAGGYYLIMEDAGSLQLLQWWSSNKNKYNLLKVIGEIISGLAAIHDGGCVHRDIKPQNIMINGGEHVKIIDFGVSNFITQFNSLLKTRIGTPLYMAPEMLDGKPYSPKVDIWALGVLIYEITTGVRPFGNDPSYFLRDVSTREPDWNPFFTASAALGIKDIKKFCSFVHLMLRKEDVNRSSTADICKEFINILQVESVNLESKYMDSINMLARRAR
ncbi:MAG: protein kinase, partial [Oscillospiraceae bacterium]|nr:protein kinase [Oscillospiraceae bacterium]